jgi:UDP-N-acetylmuramyl pentapeptide synthase
MGTREAIALEKGMLAEAVDSNGAVVLCADNDMTPSITARCRARVVHAGLSGGDITADSIAPDGPGVSFNIIASGSSQRASITVPGDHMVQNALLAVAAGLELGVTLENCLQGLAKTRIASGRLERREIRGVHYLDDSYNANPDSMEAALQTLRSLPGQGHRIAVLGKMGELGDYAAEGYRRTGNAAGKLADILITVGNEAAPIAVAAREAGLGRIHEVADTASAARMLAQLAKPGDFVLVKGSRSARMETVIENLPN